MFFIIRCIWVSISFAFPIGRFVLLLNLSQLLDFGIKKHSLVLLLQQIVGFIRITI
jgi:hypothetical protein